MNILIKLREWLGVASIIVNDLCQSLWNGIPDIFKEAPVRAFIACSGLSFSIAAGILQGSAGFFIVMGIGFAVIALFSLDV